MATATITKKVGQRELSPLPLLDEEIVLREFAAAGIKAKHAYSMWRHVLHNDTTDLQAVPNLPRAAYELLRSKFVLTTSTVESVEHSADGSTSKLLVRMQDGQLVETVIMRYGRVELASFPKERLKRSRANSTSSVDSAASLATTGSGGSSSAERAFKSNPRATVCISSQVGCQMGCTFCATGTMGLTANLTAGEILEQLYHANQVETIRNVVFMGMGEPLDNYAAVVLAIRGMTDVQRFSLQASRISVSTVGVVPRLRTLARDAPGISLALSLHAPTQALRAEIVPSSKAWHIDRIMEATDAFVLEQSARKANGEKVAVLIEYVLIADVNDSLAVAAQLGGLLENRSVVLNVIPYNPTDVPHDYRPPTRAHTEAFCAAVRGFGVRVILRQELGQDINSACGQLVIKAKEPGCSTESSGGGGGAADIEDLMAGPPKPRAQGAAAVRRRPQGTSTSTSTGSASGDAAATAATTASAAEDGSFLARHGAVLTVVVGLLAIVVLRRVRR